MRFNWRVGVIISGLFAAIAVLVYLRFALDATMPDASSSLEAARKWFAIISALYALNFILAWRFSDSWPLTLGRLLTFGIVAYICMDNVIYIFGENSEIVWQLVGLEEPSDTRFVHAQRNQLITWSVGFALAVACIAIGFERWGTGAGQNNDFDCNGEVDKSDKDGLEG